MRNHLCLLIRLAEMLPQYRASYSRALKHVASSDMICFRDGAKARQDAAYRKLERTGYQLQVQMARYDQLKHLVGVEYPEVEYARYTCPKLGYPKLSCEGCPILDYLLSKHGYSLEDGTLVLSKLEPEEDQHRNDNVQEIGESLVHAESGKDAKHVGNVRRLDLGGASC